MTKLGLEEISRVDNPAGKFTLVFLAAPGDAETAKEKRTPTVELTYNYDPEDYEGAATSGIWPMQWTTSTRPASG